MARGRPRSPVRGEHLGLTKPLTVPDVDWGGNFAATPAPLAISNDRLDLLKKLLDENPDIAAEIEMEN